MSDLSPSNLRGAVDLSGLVNRANRPTPSPGAAPASAPASGLVFDSSDAEFQSVLELSARVPVVVEFIAPGLASALGPIVESYQGRLVLAVVDGSANPQLAQAFQVREVPAVAAVVGGRPVNLFLGIPSDAEVRQVFDELLQLAAENGVTGRVPTAEGEDAPDGAEAEPVEEPLPPHHQEAYDAIERGDYPAAIAAYRSALAENPRDQLAVAGLAQVSLLDRLSGAGVAEIRDAAAARPTDVDAQLAVADLDVSGGHLDDAFGRLLELFAQSAAPERDRIRARLLDYFEIAGGDDPRVVTARRSLATLLY
ncbi:co-chaperone YbbN [Homoserinibacter sp. GY 40078]|uniref:co-chaperone YbbN n=1 Tax=Homoserinibacter sp. GY 40078 TaxID=2603275 RepID=UPI0011C9410D|nr:tetratricopeptide repeat protein [Homoserinibacter sp. GY 40078]TXK17061.1 tetratricopeptide repeat protein [Homoserinibacter sp. GY 40078]